MMKISYKGDYALKAILDLAQHYNSAINLEEISRRQDIPLKFLEQIMLILRRAGFVLSKRGARGGYFLARHPKDIYIGEVVRAIDGPIAPISCVADKNKTLCNFASCCALRDVFEEVKNKISEVIDKVSFADLVKRTNKKTKKGIDFSI